jgi:hypothetical protein
MGIDAERAAVSWPHVSPHCPEIHTQQFPGIFCVNPTLVSTDGWFPRSVIDPELPLVALGFAAVRWCR